MVLALDTTSNWRVEIGDTVELRRPDGTRTSVRVTGIDRLEDSLLFGPPVEKTDLPAGTEVWTNPTAS